MIAQTETSISLRGGRKAVDFYWIAGLAVAAIALRFVYLGRDNFRVDEVNSLIAVRDGVWSRVAFVESTPPFSYLLLKCWSYLWGSSHLALRSLFAVCGGLAAGAMYACARAWGLRRSIAALLGVWIVLHPSTYDQSREARYYALLLLIGIVWYATVPDALLRRAARGINWWFVGLGWLGFATHYYFGFLVLTACAVALWNCARLRPFSALLECRAIRSSTALLILTGVSASYILLQTNHGPTDFLKTPHLAQLLEIYVRLYFYGSQTLNDPARWMTFAAVLMFVPLMKGRRLASGAPLTALIGLAILPNVMAFAVSVLWKPIFYPERYSILFLPAFMLLMGWIWNALWDALRRPWCLMMAAGIIALGVIHLHAVWSAPQGFDWEGAARRVAREWRAGDAMVFYPEWLNVSYEQNGGEARNTTTAGEAAGLRGAGRVWLFVWEQAPEDRATAAVRAMEGRAGTEALEAGSGKVIAFSRIPQTNDDRTSATGRTR